MTASRRHRATRNFPAMISEKEYMTVSPAATPDMSNDAENPPKYDTVSPACGVSASANEDPVHPDGIAITRAKFRATPAVAAGSVNDAPVAAVPTVTELIAKFSSAYGPSPDRATSFAADGGLGWNWGFALRWFPS